MIIQNRPLRIAIVVLLSILVIPLLVMLGMMLMGMSGAVSMGGMMSSMGVGMMALCALWSALVAAALIFLIVLLTRDVRSRESSYLDVSRETGTRRAA